MNQTIKYLSREALHDLEDCAPLGPGFERTHPDEDTDSMRDRMQRWYDKGYLSDADVQSAWETDQL